MRPLLRYFLHSLRLPLPVPSVSTRSIGIIMTRKVVVALAMLWALKNAMGQPKPPPGLSKALRRNDTKRKLQEVSKSFLDEVEVHLAASADGIKVEKLAIFLMTKDDMALIVPWLAYHGHVFGFENLYVLDGSTGTQQEFLAKSSENLKFNLRHSLTDLNTVEGEFNEWMTSVKNSYSWLIKVDTDEFVVSDTRDWCKSPVIHGNTHLRTNRMFSYDGPMVRNIITDPNKNGTFPQYKQVYDSRLFTGMNLGGHAFGEFENSDVSIIHFHDRGGNKADRIRKSFMVLLSHGYVLPSDDRAVVLQKLKSLPPKPNCQYHSCHKVWEVMEFMEKERKKPTSGTTKVSLMMTTRLE